MRAVGWMLGVCGLLAAPALRAETLGEAWSQALAHDQTLAAASADAAAARADERAARGARWPSLEASGGYTRLDNAPSLDVATPSGATLQSVPIFKDNQYFSGSVQMRLPVYTGGQVSAGIDAARSVAAGAGALESATVANVKLEVAEAYVAVLRSRHALEAAQASVASLGAHAADVQHMVDSESVPMSDLLAARVALANAEQARVRAANAVDVAQAAYNRRLGQPLERAPSLEERLPADAALADETVAALMQRALGARSELAWLADRADALAAQARAEAAKARPQLALVGGYTHYDNQILDRENVASIGANVTWNLFDGGQARNRADGLRSASRAQERRLDDLRSQIALEVRSAWLGVQEARARVQASRETVAQAEENLRMSRELYGVGLGTNTQVLEAVALRATAVTNHDDAQLDESLARLRLARSVGAL